MEIVRKADNDGRDLSHVQQVAGVLQRAGFREAGGGGCAALRIGLGEGHDASGT
jgi:hypothetical protein